jgi:hypothetical protein
MATLQPKIRVYRCFGMTVFLGVCMALPPGYGQETTPSSNIPPVPERAAPLPQVTVTAKMLRQRVDTYISKVSRGSLGSTDRPLARWRVPICPLVAGLPRKDGQFIFDRISDDFESTGVPLGQEGCYPNFFIVATSSPEATLKAWWHRNFNLNGGQTGFTDFIGKPRPVRIWYNARLISGDGTPASRSGVSGAFRGVESFSVHVGSLHTEFGLVPDLMSVIVVIDLTSVSGMDWRQVTDYIAMAGSTDVNLDGHVDGAPSIMSLFSTSAQARPPGWSVWDQSFVKELYLTDPVSRRQRISIAKAMLKDVASDAGERQ